MTTSPNTTPDQQNTGTTFTKQTPQTFSRTASGCTSSFQSSSPLPSCRCALIHYSSRNGNTITHTPAPRAGWTSHGRGNRMRRRERYLPTPGAKPQPRATYTCVRLFLARSQARPAQRSVPIPTVWNDLCRGLGPILCRASSRPRASLGRHSRSRVRSQRSTPFRMGPRHFQYRAGTQTGVGRLLDENLYIRGDNTRVYFFELDELALLFTGSPAPPTAQETLESKTTTEVDEGNGDDDGEEEECEVPAKDDLPASSHISPSLDPSFTSPGDPSGHSIHPSLRDPNALGLPHPLFTIEQLGVDRRLIVNRKRQLKMYRVWMQGKFQRTDTDALPLVTEPDKSPP